MRPTQPHLAALPDVCGLSAMPADMAGAAQFMVFGMPQAELVGTIEAPNNKACTQYLLRVAARASLYQHVQYLYGGGCLMRHNVHLAATWSLACTCGFSYASCAFCMKHCAVMVMAI